MDLCRDVWATFDIETMRWGLALMITSLLSIGTVVAVDTRRFPAKSVLVMTIGGLGASFVDWLFRQNVVCITLNYRVQKNRTVLDYSFISLY